MSGNAGRRIVVVHQFDPDAWAHHVAPHAPAAMEFRALPADAGWEIPADAEVLVSGFSNGRPVPTDKPPGWPRNLKWVQLETTGIERHPAWVFAGPPVTCGRGSNAEPIAEYVLATMLAFEKHIPELWVRRAADWRIAPLGGLSGKTLGLVGIGTIGLAIARKAAAFGMRILAYRRTAAPSPLSGVTLADLNAVAAEADHFVVAAPLTAATRNLITAQVFTRMKPSAHLINISRGGLIDQEALLAALNGERLARATLDVTTPEPLPEGHALYTHARVRLSPHVSWSGAPSPGFFPFLVENLRRYAAGEALNGLVSYEQGY